MIVPHKTQCYGDSTDPPEEGIPMCTLRNFPNQIEHCIEWSREKFNTSFVTTPSEVVQYLSDPEKFVSELKLNENTAGQLTKLRAIRDFI